MTRPDPSLRQQATVRSALRVVGPILLGLGLLLVVVAFADFFATFNDSERGMPQNFWLAFIGLPLIAIGGALTRAAYLGPASRYVAGEVTPTIRDTLGALGVGPSETVCANCGHANDAGSEFCNACGKPLTVSCSACGTANAPDARFCDHCGQPLPMTGREARA